MGLTSNFRPGRLIVVAFAACAVIALGCRQSEQIQTYTVQKEAKADAVAASKSGESTDRMLAAILPAGSQAWFFKAVGPIAEIDKHEKQINEFFAGLTLAEDGRARWKLPADWKEEAGNDVRIATIVIPGDKRLEITVTRLPWPGMQEGLLVNVNRWRGQLQLPPIGPKQLGDVTHESKAGERPITIVDLRGRFKAGGMTPPFAGGPFTTSSGKARNSKSNLPAGHPPIDDANSQPPGGLAAGHPPIDSAAESPGGIDENRTAGLPKFTMPQSWKQLAAQPPRKVDFVVGEGQQAAHVTMTDFPANAGPMIADQLSNINRWRGEIGLSEIQKKSLPTATESIEVGGEPATYAAMIPDASKPEDSKAKEATLAAIVKDGEKIWFIKMKGDRDLVAKHQDEFRTFLKSIKFSANGKAGNGNQ